MRSVRFTHVGAPNQGLSRPRRGHGVVVDSEIGPPEDIPTANQVIFNVVCPPGAMMRMTCESTKNSKDLFFFFSNLFVIFCSVVDHALVRSMVSDWR